MDKSEFTFTDGKRIVAAPCLEITAFSFAPPSDCGPGFTRLLATFIDRFGAALTFHQTGDMKRARAFEPAAVDAPRHWFADSDLLATKRLALRLHAGPQSGIVLPPGAEISLTGFQKVPRFVFRLMLPVDAGDEPDATVQFVQQAFEQFPLASGHVGYSFVWDRTDPAAAEAACDWAAPLLLRHPGLGYGSAVMLSNAASSGLVAVGWLTLLGAGICAELGGLAPLHERAPADVSVLPLGQGGVLLRAGAAPQLGDVNRADPLPTYRAVGRLVGSRRASDDALDEVVIDGMSERKAHAWLRRFFV